MVDIWLLFCIVMNFIIIVIHAAVDTLIEEDYYKSNRNSTTSPIDYFNHHTKVAVQPAWEGGENGDANEQSTKIENPKKKGLITLNNLVLFSRYFVFSIFGIFNICYWAYILS